MIFNALLRYTVCVEPKTIALKQGIFVYVHILYVAITLLGLEKLVK